MTQNTKTTFFESQNANLSTFFQNDGKKEVVVSKKLQISWPKRVRRIFLEKKNEQLSANAIFQEGDTAVVRCEADLGHPESQEIVTFESPRKNFKEKTG